MARRRKTSTLDDIASFPWPVGIVLGLIWSGLALPVPGPVVGLALLLLTLVLRPSVLDGIKPTAQTLLQHLSLLFVPAGVGVMLHLQRLGDEALAIGVALVVSTLVGLASAALTMAWLMKRTGR